MLQMVMTKAWLTKTLQDNPLGRFLVISKIKKYVCSNISYKLPPKVLNTNANPSQGRKNWQCFNRITPKQQNIHVSALDRKNFSTLAINSIVLRSFYFYWRQVRLLNLGTGKTVETPWMDKNKYPYTIYSYGRFWYKSITSNIR